MRVRTHTHASANLRGRFKSSRPVRRCNSRSLRTFSSFWWVSPANAGHQFFILTVWAVWSSSPPAQQRWLGVYTQRDSQTCEIVVTVASPRDALISWLVCSETGKQPRFLVRSGDWVIRSFASEVCVSPFRAALHIQTHQESGAGAEGMVSVKLFFYLACEISNEIGKRPSGRYCPVGRFPCLVARLEMVVRLVSRARFSLIPGS